MGPWELEKEKVFYAFFPSGTLALSGSRAQLLARLLFLLGWLCLGGLSPPEPR